MITIEDFLRYSRQMMLPEIGETGQKKLKNARILIIGAGGLGCPILQYLSTAGVGNIGVVDFDNIEMHNLHRQILYTEKNIGQAKVTTATSVAETLNPLVNFLPIEAKLTTENATHNHYRRPAPTSHAARQSSPACVPPASNATVLGGIALRAGD